ncbi:hypothetical protein ANN_06649 [Periplaneta americana]|uniref:Uncharacterized protein n=1 Tax=Periplaneta americana TaxID=6978 RepID=A0ABQ8TE53_PERAM|nr:hypothetical protein ANN_06649 [Periplaneta americana]
MSEGSEDLAKNRFQNMGGVAVGERRIKCIRCSDDMALLVEEMILRDDSCQQYENKINADKTKTMVVGRKKEECKVTACGALWLIFDELSGLASRHYESRKKRDGIQRSVCPSCGNKNRNKEIETCGNRASSTPHVNRRSASRNRKSRSAERTDKNSNSSSGQKKSEITNRRIDELTGVNDIRAYLSKLENTVFTDPFRRKKSEEGQPSMEEDAGTSEDAVWGAEAQTERTTSEGRLRRASENSTRRSDCGSTGKVSDQFIRMPHAVGSPECARGSATVWRNCALPTDGVEEGDEQLLREEKDDHIKGNFYEELERAFDQLFRYHVKILLGDFNAKVERQDIFKPTIGKEPTRN